jgi:hypothetical protein
MNLSEDAALRELALAHPWPAEPPDVAEDWHGWLCADTAAALVEACRRGPRVIVELGSWLGYSARAMLENAPGATLICIDHWQGSPEHQPETGNLDWSRRLPTLYPTFLRNLWPWRARVIPLRADTLVGMCLVVERGVIPGLVYVDSEHSVERVSDELAFITNSWPTAEIVGDDYDNSAVKLAADCHAAKTGRRLIMKGAAFCFPPILPR